MKKGKAKKAERFTVLTSGGVPVTLIASAETMAGLKEKLEGSRYLPKRRGG